MGSQFEKIFTSLPFTFYIGESRSPIVVHSKAIELQSDYFKALISGGMRETHTQSAELLDITVGDFIRFCEYAYNGHYTAPSCVIEPKVAPTVTTMTTTTEASTSGSSCVSAPFLGNSFAVQQPHPLGNFGSTTQNTYTAAMAPAFGGNSTSQYTSNLGGFGSFGGVGRPTASAGLFGHSQPSHITPAAESTPLTKAERLRKTFEDRTILKAKFNPTSRSKSPNRSKQNRSPEENYTEVFLVHARLHVFAQSKLVVPLQGYSLSRLHSLLVKFTLYPERIGDVLELTRYAYSNEYTDLQEIVVTYLVSQQNVIGKSTEFQELLEEGGHLVSDFWRLVRAHLL